MASDALSSPRREVAPRSQRRDNWWVEPLTYFIVLTAFGIYSFWAVAQNANYYAAPYLSPFYSPCIVTSCQHVTLPLIGTWWNLSPAFLVMWIPLGFRATCYYYRKAYYRSFFLSPPACAVPDARKSYKGEISFPFVLQNYHRYFFYLALVVIAFLWYDTILAFFFPDGFGVGLGSLVLLTNVILLSLYQLSCHTCRYLCGGFTDSFHNKSFLFRLWSGLTRLNERHMNYAWVSLVFVALTDLYVRLVASGVIQDVRFI